MSVLLEFSMFPTDQGESVSEQVSKIIALIRDSGVDYQLTPMGTIIETGSLPQALNLVAQCALELEQAGCKRIYASVKLDIRQGRTIGMQGKIDAIRKRIGDIST